MNLFQKMSYRFFKDVLWSTFAGTKTKMVYRT